MRSTTQRWGLARLITASPARACITILATMRRTFSTPTAIASRRSTRVGSTLRHNAFESQDLATDSENIIRSREPLSIHWPEAVDAELTRYPHIATLQAERPPRANSSQGKRSAIHEHAANPPA